MSSSLGELRFPLEERFLARVRVSSNRFEDWKATAQREIELVLHSNASWYYRPNDLKQSYRSVYEKDAIRGFVRAIDTMPSSPKKDVLSLAHLEATLDDLIFGLHAVTTPDQRAVYAQLYGVTLLDGAILRVHEGQTSSDPFHFVGLKWLAFASPAPAIISHRDYVFFEYSGTAQDAAGRKVLFVYQKSFLLQGEELTEPDKGCTRGSYYQLTLMRMEGGGVLYQATGRFDPCGDVPAWVATRGITEHFNSIKNLVGLADSRAIFAAGMIKHASTPKSASENKACVVCRKKFNVLRSRQGCRSCGQSMCKHCVTNLAFFNDEALFTNVPAILQENFCINCVKHARERRYVDNLSATLTKTNIALVTTTTTSTVTLNTRTKSDAVSSTSSTSSHDGRNPHQHSHRREHLRTSIERQAGLTASGSGVTQSTGSYASLASPTPAGNEANAMFEQMNESIRQQEELLMVIQQERAKIQARQQYQPPPPPAAAPSYYVTSQPAMHHSPVSPSDRDVNDSDARFEVLS